MNTLLILSFIVCSSELIVNGEFRISDKYMKGVFEQFAKEKCNSQCHERSQGCKEYENNMAICENVEEKVQEKNYDTCYRECAIEGEAFESPVVCSYDCLRSAYKMEGMSIPNNLFDEYVDNLEEE